MNTYDLFLRRISQPIGDFFITSVPACDIVQLATANIREIIDKEEERRGLQRQLKKERQKQIKAYIEAADASFPNSVILNIDKSKLVSFDLHADEPYGKIYKAVVEKTPDTFSIIDGQHRLNGFDGNNCQNFDIIASVFIDIEPEIQAYIFTSVNVNQKAVDKSLAYDLFDLAKTPSPQKTAHAVVKLLNSQENSPLYRTISLLGRAPVYKNERLYDPQFSQGTIIQRLIGLISEDPSADRDLERREIPIPVERGWLKKGLIFRKFYVERSDWVIFKIMRNYFSAWKDVFSDTWNAEDSPFSRTIGLGALMRLMVPMYQDAAATDDASEIYFRERVKAVKRRYEEVCQKERGFKLTMQNYGPAGSSELQIYKFLHALAGYSDLESFIRDRQAKIGEIHFE